jgi:hypothetical protein
MVSRDSILWLAKPEIFTDSTSLPHHSLQQNFNHKSCSVHKSMCSFSLLKSEDLDVYHPWAAELHVDISSWGQFLAVR